jgi:hypothetical protein
MALRNALSRAAGPLRAMAVGSASSGLIGLEVAPRAAAAAASRAARAHHCGRNLVEDEIYDRSRQEITLGNRVPSVAGDAWIAPNATLVGDTDVADQCSVWHGSVLKGDLGAVRLGAFSNVQERCVIDAAGYVPISRFPEPAPPDPDQARDPPRAARASAPPSTIKSPQREAQPLDRQSRNPRARRSPTKTIFSSDPSLALLSLSLSLFAQRGDAHRTARDHRRRHVHLLRDRRG